MSDVVPYDQLTAFLKDASAFEIYRLSVALKHELDNPKRLAYINKKVTLGDTVEYFEARAQTFIKATVVRKTSKFVVVFHDGQQWKIPLYMLKIDSRDFIFEEKDKGLNKNNLKMGDLVGFHHQEHVITGAIQRLNQKTVTIITPTQKQWRVSYSLLHQIIDGESIEASTRQLLDGY
jgi:hypothetical protein